MSLANLDFLKLYKEQMTSSKRPEKNANEWNFRAKEIQKRPLISPYSKSLLEHIDLTGIHSILDVGCGNGALSIPLSKCVKKIVAIDFSPAMIDGLKDNVNDYKISNIQPVLRAWEDDWSDIEPCDLLLSSRSSTVKDFQVVVDKIRSHALKRVVITQPVNGSFTDPDIVKALGYTKESTPDYIYTLNILHQMGIHPTLNYIDTYSRFAFNTCFEDFLQRICWSFGELSSEQIRNLERWYESDTVRAKAGGKPMSWAVIEFDVNSS